MAAGSGLLHRDAAGAGGAGFVLLQRGAGESPRGDLGEMCGWLLKRYILPI